MPTTAAVAAAIRSGPGGPEAIAPLSIVRCTTSPATRAQTQPAGRRLRQDADAADQLLQAHQPQDGLVGAISPGADEPRNASRGHAAR